MPIELKISWEGEARGVPEHRLSIGEFGPALSELLRAYRRIASNMMRSAAPYAESGKLKDLANFLDIEIEHIEGNTLQVSAVCTFNPPIELQPSFLPDDIPERASKELLDSIEDESDGRPRNRAVRSYLAKLPKLARQKYELSDNGSALHDPVVIERVNLATPTLGDLAHLVEFGGSVIGVGFQPGTSEVRVKPDDNDIPLRLVATPELVETALELRGSLVRGLAVRGKELRLLRLTSADAMPFRLTPELHTQYVFHRWEGVLRRLA